jgi:hypothetical protein
LSASKYLLTAVFNEGNAFTRFRLSQNNSLEPGGPATMPFPYGEVEDYKLPLGKVGNYVWEDWNFDGDQDADEPAINDVPVELIWAGLDGQIGTADDVVYPTVTGPASGQEDGEYYICGLINGDYKIVIQSPELMTPTRWDVGDDVFDSDGEVINMDLSMVMEEFTIADVTMLPTGENAPGDSGPDGVGTFPDEQVDETHDYGFAFLDYGDLPEFAQGQDFNTTMAEGGPIHVIYPGFKMGATVDPELEGAPDDDAGLNGGGDDAIDTDDEDGISFATPLIPGFEACLDVDMMNSTGSDAVLARLDRLER